METKSPPGGSTKARNLAIAIAVTGLWSASALAATTARIHCDQLATELESLEAPDPVLSAEPVEHVTIDSDSSLFDGLEVEILTDDAVTPFLFIAPRVANLLRDVFGSTDEDWAPATPSTSPLAGMDDIDDADPAEGNSPAFRFREELPQIQRQMYRIDI